MLPVVSAPLISNMLPVVSVPRNILPVVNSVQSVPHNMLPVVQFSQFLITCCLLFQSVPHNMLPVVFSHLFPHNMLPACCSVLHNRHGGSVNK